MDDVAVLLVVGDHQDVEAVRRACEARGLKQAIALPRLHQLKGLVAPSNIAELAATPGVSSVERERKIQLPPSNSPIQ